MPDVDDASLSHIRVVTNWGSDMTNDTKIPSVITYSKPTEAHEQQFGANLSPDAVAMVNTKLELDVQDTRLDELNMILQVLDGMKDLSFEHIKASKGYPEYTWKKPEDIVTDYLTKAFKSFEAATDYIAEIRRTAPVDIIVTVPVVSVSACILIPLPDEMNSDGRTGQGTLPSGQFVPQGSTNATSRAWIVTLW